MKNKSYRILINTMFWIFIFGFIIHLFSFGLHIIPRNLKYGYGGWNNHKDSVWQLTAYGPVRIQQKQAGSIRFNQTDTLGKRTDIKIYNSAIAAFYYSDFNKAWNENAILVILLEVIYSLCWLVITFQLLLIFISLKRNMIFERVKIRRLKIIAFMIGIAPFAKMYSGFLFRRIIDLNLDIKGYIISNQFTQGMMFELLTGLIPAVLVFILAEIFKYGLFIKHENDLTI